MKTFLLLSILSVFPAETQPDARMDWGFMEAQERWVIENHGANRMLELAPMEIMSIYYAMGRDDWRARDEGSRRMLALGMRAMPWCFLAQYLPDKEVGLRCRTVLRKLSMCKMCGGRGKTGNSNYDIYCGTCYYIGHHAPFEDLLEAMKYVEGLDR